jgi:uncharacterized protein YoxC
MPENQEIHLLLTKLAVNRERIINLEKQLKLQDELIMQKINNLEQDINNKLLILNNQINYIHSQLQYINNFNN